MIHTFCSKSGATKRFAVSLLQVQGAQEVLEDPWGAWEAAEETEEASHQEGPAVPGGTRLEEEMSSTELETGSAPTRMYFSQPTPERPAGRPFVQRAA